MIKVWCSLNECVSELEEEGQVIILGNSNAKIGEDK